MSQRERTMTRVEDLQLTAKAKADVNRRREALIALGDITHRQASELDVNAAVEARVSQIRNRDEAQRLAEYSELASLSDNLTDEQRERIRYLDSINPADLEETIEDVYDSDGLEIDQYHRRWQLRQSKQHQREQLKRELAELAATRRTKDREPVSFNVNPKVVAFVEEDGRRSPHSSSRGPLERRRRRTIDSDIRSDGGHSTSSTLTTGSSEIDEIEAQRAAIRQRSSRAGPPRLTAVRRSRLQDVAEGRTHADRREIRHAIRKQREDRVRRRQAAELERYRHPCPADRFLSDLPAIDEDLRASVPNGRRLQRGALKAAALALREQRARVAESLRETELEADLGTQYREANVVSEETLAR